MSKSESSGASQAQNKPVGTGILITGASSGIGRALALEWARPGAVIGLVARRRERLETLGSELESKGARALTYPADVTDQAAMGQVAQQFIAGTGGVSLVVANAGIGGADRLRHGDPSAMNEIFSVNVQGAINTIVPFIPHMMEQGRGHLAAVGSVAGFRGMPGKGAYCASKAALKMLMDSYRPALRPHGIRVTTISPGWVVSELTAKNAYRMPFMMETDRAARLIARAIARGKRNYVFPWQMRLALPLIRNVPDWVLPSRV